MPNSCHPQKTMEFVFCLQYRVTCLVFFFFFQQLRFSLCHESWLALAMSFKEGLILTAFVSFGSNIEKFCFLEYFRAFEIVTEVIK